MSESNTQGSAAKKAAAAPAKKAASAAPAKGEQPVANVPNPTTDENLSSARARPQQGAGGDTDAVRENIAKHAEENAGEKGPNHDLIDPTPENTTRMPSATMEANPESGRLEAPTDALLQRDPVEGYGLSSTDHTYAAAGGRTIAGERFDSLVDENDKAVTADSLFEAQDGKTFVLAKSRVFEVFFYPNTHEKAKRLLYTPGQRVNIAEAERIKATLK
jgi:hypothetical protein